LQFLKCTYCGTCAIPAFKSFRIIDLNFSFFFSKFYGARALPRRIHLGWREGELPRLLEPILSARMVGSINVTHLIANHCVKRPFETPRGRCDSAGGLLPDSGRVGIVMDRSGRLFGTTGTDRLSELTGIDLACCHESTLLALVPRLYDIPDGLDPAGRS
jgi:hypothetical protein